MTAITAKTASAPRVLDRAALRAELEATNTQFRTLVESLSEERWRQPCLGSAWTVGEVMVHLTWALEQLPAEVASARRGQGMFNYLAWLADPVSYWTNRWDARGATRASVVGRYDAAMAAVLASLDTVADGDWALGANFYGHGFYTIEGLFHTPAQHLAEHTAALANLGTAAANDGAFIATRVGPLHVRQIGSGPPALLWHSLFVDSASWHHVEPDLSADRRLILIDGPGHGASGDSGKPYTLRACAEAALDVLNALGVTEPVDWVGNAWGGHVGITLAAAHPERLRSLIAIGAPVAAYTPAGARETRLLLALYRLLGPAGFIRNAVAEVLLSPATRERDPAAADYVRAQIGSADRRRLRNAVESISLGREDLTGLLPDIRVPTLFMTGAHHTGFTPEQARESIDLVPGGQLATVPDAAYLVPLEQPDETARVVRTFWAATRG
jgi:pimeloyl-ACP methyl ester carboxylesterase